MPDVHSLSTLFMSVYTFGRAQGLSERELTLRARFFQCVKIDRKTGCHLWTGRRDANGYGVFRVSIKAIRAYRVAYLFRHGQLPPGKPVVRHTCDNRPCVNDDHLIAGTHRDNANDAISRGRMVPPPARRGVEHWHAQITEKTALKILRSKGVTNAEIARRLKVPLTTVKHIRGRTSWRHFNA